ncbi:GRL1A-like protein [Mya arenaria]|uniref:GRL1A-like protein n=1 Tax=Mya arenaria TaxID=6604 RepID=A0ABY7DQ96_MYAAR|nr:DNA-directed RNA polymerase II subunit GRINL1A-like [Mya arenaria]XP_052792910.1 DNA-directed RNA polymerase II subunit GRINL1A-like [Mya arenaria]WAQ99886.1 GRL1A-like protein [Mya arenaria]
MGEAFYPTNDGKFGNIQKLSDVELHDIIRRREHLLKRKAFLNSLPDKGAKAKGKLEILNQERERRNLLKAQKTHKCTEQVGDSEELAETIQHLRIGDLGDEGHVQGTKHQFEIVEQRAQENMKAGMRQTFKPNSNIHAEHVKDLPEEIRNLQPHPPDPARRSHVSGTTQDVKLAESAAVPPNYRYLSAQPISLQESLDLQKQQKLKYQELHAELTAERLAQSLGIKMDSYTPEGVDMSYRQKLDENIDSDDDVDNENTVPGLTMGDSDSEPDET